MRHCKTKVKPGDMTDRLLRCLVWGESRRQPKASWLPGWCSIGTLQKASGSTAVARDISDARVILMREEGLEIRYGRFRLIGHRQWHSFWCVRQPGLPDPPAPIGYEPRPAKRTAPQPVGALVDDGTEHPQEPAGLFSNAEG